jgi:nucleoside-diphosphate-sugar epimerase
VESDFRSIGFRVWVKTGRPPLIFSKKSFSFVGGVSPMADFSNDQTMEISSALSASPVLVTGGSGFLAGHIIQRLLSAGYRVRATVQSFRESDKFAHLTKFKGALQRLEIVETQLQNRESWTAAFKDGVEFVIHTACPYLSTPEDTQKQIIDPMVEGMQNILDQCLDHPSVKKLVITSCAVTVCDTFEQDREYSERDWNETSSIERRAHAYGKVLAEKKAFDFVKAIASTRSKGCPFKVAAILPSVMLGPHLSGGISYSHELLLIFIENRIRGILNCNFYVTDVRDAATAHINALENSHIEGRYLVAAEAPTSLKEMLQIAVEHFPDHVQVPTWAIPDFMVRNGMGRPKTQEQEWILHNLNKKPRLSLLRAAESGMLTRPTAQTIVDTVRYLLDSGNIVRGVPPSVCSIL